LGMWLGLGGITNGYRILKGTHLEERRIKQGIRREDKNKLSLRGVNVVRL